MLGTPYGPAETDFSDSRDLIFNLETRIGSLKHLKKPWCNVQIYMKATYKHAFHATKTLHLSPGL